MQWVGGGIVSQACNASSWWPTTVEVQASGMLAGDHRSLARQREARRTAAIPQVQRSWVEIRYRRSFSSKKSSFSVICVILLLPCSHVREVNKNFSLTVIGDSHWTAKNILVLAKISLTLVWQDRRFRRRRRRRDQAWRLFPDATFS